MDIENLFVKELKIDENFDYKKLYNDSRGAVHKDDYKALLYWGIKEKIINIKKYLIAEKVHQDVFYNIAEKNSEGLYELKERLKDYHQESYFNVAPFIFLLEKLEPKYRIKLDKTENEEPIFDFSDDIAVGHRFDGTNAFSRLFLKKDKQAINSFNDNVENLMDTLEIDGISVYILDVEDKGKRESNVVVYQLVKDAQFNELKDKAEHRFLEEIFKYRNI